MDNNLGNDLRKLAMAGIGAVAAAADKSQEVLEELSKRGEEAVAQGRVVNEQLKHNLRQAVKDNITVVDADSLNAETLMNVLDKLSAEQRETLKAKLAELDKNQQEPQKQGEEGNTDEQPNG